MPSRLGSQLTVIFPSGLRAVFFPRSAPRLLRIAPKHRSTVCAAAGGLGGRANGQIPPDPGACENLFCPPQASLMPSSHLTWRDGGGTSLGRALTFGLQLPRPDLSGPPFPIALVSHRFHSSESLLLILSAPPVCMEKATLLAPFP